MRPPRSRSSRYASAPRGIEAANRVGSLARTGAPSSAQPPAASKVATTRTHTPQRRPVERVVRALLIVRASASIESALVEVQVLDRQRVVGHGGADRQYRS